MGDADGELVEGIRAVIAATGDPGRARAQQAYMKSEMPYRGIGSPELRRVLRPLLKGYVPASRESWTATVLALWDGAPTARSGTPPSTSRDIGWPGRGWTRGRWGCGGTWS